MISFFLYIRLNLLANYCVFKLHTSRNTRRFGANNFSRVQFCLIFFIPSQNYIRQPWNVFDLVTVIGSIIDIIITFWGVVSSLTA